MKPTSAQIPGLALVKTNNELYKSWIAGANIRQNPLLKNLKRNEIDNIDVSNLCEKLLEIRNERIRHYATSDNNTSFDATSCLPFRGYNRLVFGTLAIFKEQVNNLLVDTHNFLNTIVVDDQQNETLISDRPIKSRKRNICSIVNKAESTLPLKKSRSNDDFVIDYTKLLDEAELLVNTEPITYTPDPNQISLSKITILDSNVLDSTDCAEPVDHFGNATTEDILELINLFATDSPGDGMAPIRKTLKRKLIYDLGETTAAKIIKTSGTNNISFDASIELVRNSSTASSAIDFTSIEHEQCNDTIQIGDNGQSRASTGLDASLDAFSTFRNTHKETTHLQSPLLPTLNISPLRSKAISNAKNRKRTFRKTKTVCNVKTKLSRLEICTQSDRYLDLIKREYFKPKKQNFPKCPLNKFKFSKMFPNMLRKRNKSSSHQIFDESVNLVKDIMGSDYEATMIDEILPKSSTNKIPPTNQLQIVFRSSTASPDLDFNANIAEYESPLLSSKSKRVLRLSMSQSSNQVESTSSLTMFDSMIDLDSLLASNTLFGKFTKGHTYEVMLKVLKICIARKTNEIDHHIFLLNMPNRTEAALSFHNLLELVRDRYIFITTKPDTIESDKILLGEQPKKILYELTLPHT